MSDAEWHMARRRGRMVLFFAGAAIVCLLGGQVGVVVLVFLAALAWIMATPSVRPDGGPDSLTALTTARRRGVLQFLKLLNAAAIVASAAGFLLLAVGCVVDDYPPFPWYCDGTGWLALAVPLVAAPILIGAAFFSARRPTVRALPALLVVLGLGCYPLWWVATNA